MLDVVVVISPETKNIYYLSPNSFNLKIGDEIIFESECGISYGKVLKEIYQENKANFNLLYK